MSVSRAEQYPYDLVVGGGLLVDPGRSAPLRGDVAVRDGRIEAVVTPGSADDRCARFFDARGLLVAPGLVDLHTHVYDGRTGLGTGADAVGVAAGVTTLVDAGSAGSDSFAHFAETVVASSDTRVLSWLNVSRHGLTRGTRELAGSDDVHPAATVRTILGAPDTVRGVKVRMSRSVLGDNGLEPLRAAKRITAEVAAATGRTLPVMVHVGNAPPALGDVLDLLGPGDIVTHAFHGKPGGLFPDTEEPLPQALAALRRGVRLDVGHGSASFAFDTMERALAAGIRPHTISTDIHRENVPGPVHSLTTTMTKLLAVGLTLNETVRATTSAPAESLGLAGELGTLDAGSAADLTVLDRVGSTIELVDAEGATRTSPWLLAPVAAIRAGVVHAIRKAST
ncbi:amidohydrolase/deacetylase family metallohydrolase [Streptomyces olivaceus]|uniref:amidohydrolase/deacetylase family metallohydrolase n=1 Tax=Streptomyces olivaceus TaxID=47716 RepID=UPI0018850662|nr:amidohydrolase/deacetylase family metallohydrolase [Streptomyces olivaceus]GHI92563.1 dihydroorotase [Streptomyces olivaceus]